jgi:hypothetical protein
LKEYVNPPDRWSITIAIALLFSCLIGAYYLLMIGTSLGAIVLFFLGILLFLVILEKPLSRRPKSIGFDDEGIILVLLLNRRRIVKWDGITNIHVVEGNPQKLLGRIIRSSSLRVKGSRAPIDLSYELGMLIKDEYWKRFGDRVYQIWTYQTKRKLR